MKLDVWGTRGSLPAPGPETTRYGGNTSCVQLTLDDGATLVLDAGTGIRGLGLALAPPAGPLHILLTHLHLDHIQGLMFFAPMFRADAEIVIWGPASPAGKLVDRIARYISAPLSPLEVRELPCNLSFRDAEPTEWDIGTARVRAASVAHRGPTLGYRVEADGASVCYLPDHEPGLGAPLAEVGDEWLSGFDLARGASLLLHDCQYTDEEYPRHLGWGHSSLSDALTFGRRAGAQRVLLCHHDPLHTDEFLDVVQRDAALRWEALGGRAGRVGLAMERQRVAV
ncbi:MAG TPA: MBL fold metallo-hydrolase [Solirubrobacteraceae bacterium]|nr:MBL fold metallo-hydrolase [Solirubrobacteraceae bacterium]